MNVYKSWDPAFVCRPLVGQIECIAGHSQNLHTTPVAHHQQSPGSLGEAQPSRRVADEDGKSCHERATAITGVQSIIV